MPHNHPPRCCCQNDPRDIESGDLGREALYPRIRCASCVEHGDLTEEPRCPECQQHVGRPHTDYCLHDGTVQ